MSKFKETLERLWEETRRAHYTRKEVEAIFDDLMKSVGPYFEKDTWPKIKDNEDKVNLTDFTELDKLKVSVAKAYKEYGIQSEFKDDLKEDGYDILVQLADDLDLWRDDKPVT